MQQLEADYCVVGAGYSGLAAARTLVRTGKSVIVLEARDRVGGRVWTQHFADGTPADFGGTWLGPGHTRMFELAGEYGIVTYNTNIAGSNVMLQKGKRHTYQGLIPPVNPVDLASFYVAAKRLDYMDQERAARGSLGGKERRGVGQAECGSLDRLPDDPADTDGAQDAAYEPH
jgi:monoamine oxidase